MNRLKAKVEDLLLKSKDRLAALRDRLTALWNRWQAYRETLSPEDLQQDNSKVLACVIGAIMIPCALHGFYKRVQYDTRSPTSSPSSSSSTYEDRETKFWRDTVKELKRDKLNPFQEKP